MLTKTKIALATALFAATSSVAMAQGFDPNMANRYPSYAAPQSYGYVAGANSPTRMTQAPHASLHSAPVRLRQGRDVGVIQDRDVGLTTGRGNYSGTESEFDVDRTDRASSPYAGGGF